MSDKKGRPESRQKKLDTEEGKLSADQRKKNGRFSLNLFSRFLYLTVILNSVYNLINNMLL